MNRYSTGRDIAITFNPSAAVRLPNNMAKVYESDTPTISLVSDAYGRDVAIDWINIQLNSLDLYTNVKNDLEESARNELSELILSHYGFLKLPEFMLFMARFKLGIYGRFYGAFDPIVLCEALKKFRSDRNAELERVRIRALQKEVEAREFIPPDGYTSLSWYQELKARAQRGDSEAIEQLKPPKI